MIEKYISIRVTLGLPSIFAWQARMRSLGLPFAISQLQHVILHLIFLMSSSNEWGGVESSSYMYYVVELIRSSAEFMLMCQ